MMEVLKVIKWILLAMIIKLMLWMEAENSNFKLEFSIQKVEISLMLESETFRRGRRRFLQVLKPLKVEAFKEHH